MWAKRRSHLQHWLVLGIAGFLAVLALPSIWDAWQVDAAGILINRALITVAGTSGEVEATPGARALNEAASDYSLPSTVKSHLERALAVLETAASRGPHTSGREASIWRTYGAAARMLPSNHAFELLSRSHQAGRLDWLGELWLGEVASATGHWEDAARAYRRVDASNLLIYRAETHIRAGERELALRELSLAKTSLDAAVDRERAERLLVDRTGAEHSELESLLQRPAERATALSRIGQGLLDLDRPLEAQPILRQGLALAATSSPGATVERNLRLDLALALARTLPERPAYQPASPGYSYYPDNDEMDRLRRVIEVTVLVHEAVALDRTAFTCTRAGQILTVAGEDDKALALFSEAARLDPLLPDPYLEIGSWYEQRMMIAVARDIYAEAAERLPNEPAIAVALATSAYRTMPAQEALPFLERAAAMQTNDPTLFLYLGDCYQQLGRVADALAAWREGLRRSPGAETLQERVASLRRSPQSLP